jgi:osmoprotectant transport system permease protein
VVANLPAGGHLVAVAAFNLGNVVRWFTNGAHWRGSGGVPHRIAEHLEMSLAATLTAAIIALPIGLFVGHRRRGSNAAINVANVGRAIPSFGLLVVGFELLKGVKTFGLGALPAYIALVALAIPPIVLNSVVGIVQVDAEARDAAVGMGMTGGQILRHVEIPMSIPLIMAGIRTAGVQVVATATLAAVVGWGGLGTFITTGLATQDYVELFAGALLVAVLSLLTEVGLAALQRSLTPRGLRKARIGAKVSTLVGAAAVTEQEVTAAA